MKRIYYRVECNNGSKYFDSGVKAYAYFAKRKLQKHSVELWLLVIEDTQKLFSATQELIAYHSPKLPY